MAQSALYKRYLIFILSLLINGLGVSIVTLAALGTTPISSAWYEISLHVPLTFGMVTMLGNLILIISQYFLLEDKKDKKALFSLVTQIPATLLFSVAIDLNMWLLSPLLSEISFYPLRLVMLLVGSLILALGVSFEINVRAIPLSLDDGSSGLNVIM